MKRLTSDSVASPHFTKIHWFTNKHGMPIAPFIYIGTRIAATQITGLLPDEEIAYRHFVLADLNGRLTYPATDARRKSTQGTATHVETHFKL